MRTVASHFHDECFSTLGQALWDFHKEVDLSVEVDFLAFIKKYMDTVTAKCGHNTQ